MAWAKVNPKFRSLGTEDYGERGTDLFGPGFLEKASKRIEVKKTLAKLTNSGQPPNPKRGRYSSDRSDLRHFLAKGGSVREHEESPIPTAYLLQQVQPRKEVLCGSGK